MGKTIQNSPCLWETNENSHQKNGQSSSKKRKIPVTNPWRRYSWIQNRWLEKDNQVPTKESYHTWYCNCKSRYERGRDYLKSEQGH